VEEVMKDLHGGSAILDLCTGSGCILISLLKYSNECHGVGVDLSTAALEVASRNAQKLIPDRDCTFICGDLFENVTGKFDILTSNPPYIPTAIVDTLMPEVRDHEPRLALDGTADGLHFYRRRRHKCTRTRGVWESPVASSLTMEMILFTMYSVGGVVEQGFHGHGRRHRCDG
jgi:release factor glutamine methyltransferase